MTAAPSDDGAPVHLMAPLENSLYHLHVCGTLEDPAGDTLDGDGDGIGDDDFVRLFRLDINNAAQNGQLDCDLGSWSRATTSPEALYSFDPTRDVDQLADSGSMYIDARAGSPVFNISQCIDLPPQARVVELSTKYLLPSGSPNLLMELSCRTFTLEGCTGDIVDNPMVPFFQLAETSGDNWGFFGNQMIVTPAAASNQLRGGRLQPGQNTD